MSFPTVDVIDMQAASLSATAGMYVVENSLFCYCFLHELDVAMLVAQTLNTVFLELYIDVL